MTCREAIEFLDGYLSGELPPDLGAAFDEHFAACMPCRRYLHGYRATIRAAKAAFASDDDAVAEQVPERLVEEIIAARRRMS
jgi:anti-sigma factor RsiW